MNNTMLAPTENNNETTKMGTQSLRESVKTSLENYLKQLDGYKPVNLYTMVLEVIEPPLIEIVLNYTKGNQSKAADILGLSRSTLRKKMKLYNLE